MDQDNRNKEKNRKSEAQEIYEQADNAGRFAGDDADAKAAQETAIENIRQDTTSNREERNKDQENTDAEARRDWAQTQDYKGEAQNVNDDTGRPLSDEETRDARNKATEGMRQQRDDD
ncbi:MAG: hypothetical protein ICV81_11170 [Flavisolibacter sp.]|nr:hypothetical protein [Flavisolibacter sp.]